MGISNELAAKIGLVVDKNEKFQPLVKWHFTSQDEIRFVKKQTYQLKRPLFTLRQSPAFIQDFNPNLMFVSMP